MAPEFHFDLTLYPAPVLRRRADPVEAFDDDLAAIVAAMFERMVESQGRRPGRAPGGAAQAASWS